MNENVKWTMLGNGKWINVPLDGKFAQEIRLVPTVGFELTTYRLQGGCSTPELCGHDNAAKLRISHVVTTNPAGILVLLRGIEPPTY